MLSEEKIRIMTGIAMFEKKAGKKIFPLNRYFKSDYVSSHMIVAFFGYTLCWVLGAVLWILYRLESLLNKADISQFVGSIRFFCVTYVLGLILYMLIIRHVYRKRYEYAFGGMRVYIAKLKRLEKRYTNGTRKQGRSSEKGGLPE